MIVKKKKMSKMEPQQGGHAPVPPNAEGGRVDNDDDDDVVDKEQEEEEEKQTGRKRSRAPGKAKDVESARKELDDLQATLKKRAQEDQDLQDKLAQCQQQLRLRALEECAKRVGKGAAKTKDLTAWMQKYFWETSVDDVHIATTKDLQEAENILKQRLLEHYSRVKGARDPDTYPSRAGTTATALCCNEHTSFELARFTLAKGRVRVVKFFF